MTVVMARYRMSLWLKKRYFLKRMMTEMTKEVASREMRADMAATPATTE